MIKTFPAEDIIPSRKHRRTVRFITCTIAISSAANTSTRANRAMPRHFSQSRSTNPKTQPSAYLTNSTQPVKYKAVSPGILPPGFSFSYYKRSESSRGTKKSGGGPFVARVAFLTTDVPARASPATHRRSRDTSTVLSFTQEDMWQKNSWQKNESQKDLNSCSVFFCPSFFCQT